MDPRLLRAIAEAAAGDPTFLNALAATFSTEADRAAILSESMAAEAGRIFSAKNEAQLRAVAQAITALLAQVQQAPVTSDDGTQQAPGAPQGPQGAPAGAPAFVRQSVGATSDPAVVIAQEAVVPLAEAAKGGRGLIKVIDAGWGSSGYYDKAVLTRDAPIAWPSGTKMFWDHPTAEEAKTRPERSLRDLAAETTGPAQWMEHGPEGPGVYAPASVFAAYRPALDELHDHIGVSIHTNAHVRQGEAAGKRGPIIERLLPSPTNSIDFVTIPGRGGRVAQLFEAARGRNTEGSDVSEAELTAAREAQAAAERERDEARAERDRDRIALAVIAGRDLATETLRTADLPDASKTRIIEAAIANPPMKDGTLDRDAMKAAVTKQAVDERAYLDAVLGKGKVRGMGSGEPVRESAADPAALTESFKRIGLSDKAAATAAAGRR